MGGSSSKPPSENNKPKIDVNEELIRLRKLTENEELIRLRKYMDTGSLAKRITIAVKLCNQMFCLLTEVPAIFREDIQVISCLHQPCNDDNDLTFKIGALAELFQVNIGDWKPLIRGFKPWMKRGNTLLLKWLDEQQITYDGEKVKVWDAIIEWRNSSFPYHPTNKKLIKLINFFGQCFPIDCGQLYESVLRRFLDSLEMLQRILNDEYLLRERKLEFK